MKTTRRRLAIALASLGLLGSASAQINVEHVISIGRNALYFDDYVVSIGYFNRAIDTRPWMAEPYLYRSIAKISLEDYQGAEEDASLCIERNPFLSRAYLVRGVSRQNLNRLPEAIDDYRSGLALAPDHAGMRYNLTAALLAEKRFDEAEAESLEMIRLSPRNREVYPLRAGIALERGDTVTALVRIDEAIARDSLSALPYRLRASIAAARGEWASGIQSLSRTIELESKPSAELYANRAIMHYHTNNLRGAMADYTTALGVDAHNRISLHNRALLRQIVGELAEAITDWDTLITLEPSNFIARYNRAMLCYELGTRTRDAIEDLNHVLEQYPSFLEGFSLRSELHKRAGNRRAAERDHWHAFDLGTNQSYQAQARARSLAQRARRTRESADLSIDKYNLLIEAASSSIPSEARYTSAARGRVQDGRVQAEPIPLAYLSYYVPLGADGKPLAGSTSFSSVTERYAHLFSAERKLSIQTTLQTLTSAQIDDVQRELTEIGERVGAVPSLRRGIAHTLLQDYEQAIADYTSAIDQDKTLALAYFARALATARYREAEADRTRPAASNASAETQLLRGQADTSRALIPGQTSRTATPSLPQTIRPLDVLPSALQDLSIAISLAPDFAYGYYNRGYLYAQSGDTALAIADYSRAIELMPRLAEAYFNRGLLYIQTGNIPSATQDLSRAGELGIYQAYSIIKQIRQ